MNNDVPPFDRRILIIPLLFIIGCIMEVMIG